MGLPSRTKQFLFAGIVLMLTAIIILVSVRYFVYGGEHRTAANEQASETMTAAKLHDQFTTDETAANKQYLNKVLAVKGKVKEVKMDKDAGFMVVDLAGGEQGIAVSVTLPPDQIPDPRPEVGSSYTFRGIVNGYDPIFGYVALDQAVLQE